jgi:hypothetical protein
MHKSVMPAADKMHNCFETQYPSTESRDRISSLCLEGGEKEKIVDFDTYNSARIPR